MFGNMKKTIVGFAAVAAFSIGAQVNAQITDWVYDTTEGANSTYTGDLTAGTLNINHIAGRNFRVQRIGGGVVFTEDGFFEGTALGGSLASSMNLVSFNDSGSADGSGDTADFAGAMAGSDFVVVDEFGNSMSGNIPFFELTDRTNSLVRPGIEGQGFITDIVFSGDTFQNLTVSDLETQGTIFTFSFTIEFNGSPVNLEQYLASSGLGGVDVEIETIEAHIKGIPLPATTGLAFAGLAPFGVLTMRRRR